MQHTKQAKLAIIASVLVAASLFGGLSIAPALAQQAVASEQISRDSGENTEVEAVELSARKVTTRTDGTITVDIVQNGTVHGSADVNTDSLEMGYTAVLAEFDDPVTVEGSFEIQAAYLGTGMVVVSDMSLANGTGTDIAEDDDDSATDDDEDDGESSDSELPEGRLIASIPRSQGDTEETTIDEITMDARKITTRTYGSVYVAVTQGDEVLGLTSLDAEDLDVQYTLANLTFDGIEVTGDFDLLVLFHGAGLVAVTNVAIAGDTTTGGVDDDDDEDNGNSTDDDDPVMPPGMVHLSVEAITQNGTELSGLWVGVMDNSSTITTGFTEAEFNLTAGEYSVMVDDFTDGTTTYTFVEWQDSTQTSKTRVANLTDNETFTAVYSVQGPGAPPVINPPPTNGTDGGNPPPAGGPNTVTVHTELLDGTDLTGMRAELRTTAGDNEESGFTPATLTMEPGEDYRVVMYSFDNNYFRHWSDGGLHRYHSVSAEDSGQSLTARYEHIEDSQKAKLRVVAMTADGQPIGGTTGTSEDGTLVAEPGVEVQIAPPGSLTPFTAYTAGFSGGSEIEEQFYFINGQTYVVMMQSFDKYQFSHWQDNGSTNSARAHTLSGDVTLTAIYNVVE
jgi:hypothetical protein